MKNPTTQAFVQALAGSLPINEMEGLCQMAIDGKMGISKSIENWGVKSKSRNRF